MHPNGAMSTACACADPSVITAGRGLQVLRAFRSRLTTLRNAELVRRTGLGKATVSRLTSTLLQLGYLRIAADGRGFELAAGPLAVGHAFESSSEVLQIANPLLQSLADRLEMCATLAVPDGCDMLYIAYRSSTSISTLRFGVGSLLPMELTAIGRAYLWGLPEQERQRMMATLQQQVGAGQWAPVEAGIRESFTELEETGTCAVLGAFNRSTYAVALPVTIGLRGVRMGMSCGMASTQPQLARERRRISPVLKEAAARLQQMLAGVDGTP